jgi:hypothetical protein
MPNRRQRFISYFFIGFLFTLAACGNQNIPTESEAFFDTETPGNDPCSSANLPTTVQEINHLMREFDDASQLAPNTTAQNLPDIISNLQRIRRAAEDTQIPACLGTLKTHQLNYMNLTIQTLIAFVGGTSQEELNAGLEKARQEHDLYSLEIVRLLGITLAPITATPPAP